MTSAGNIAFLIVGLLLLFAGAEALVWGSASLALRAGLSRLLAGLTIVAFGTSAPELVVSIEAAFPVHRAIVAPPGGRHSARAVRGLSVSTLA